MAALARGRDPERPKQQVPQPVQNIHHGLRDQVEHPQPRGNQQRGTGGPRDRKTLGRQLPHHHVQERDQRKRKRGRDSGAQCTRGTAEQRLQQRLERRFADHAKGDARQRDPELTRGQIGVYVTHRVADRRRPRTS